MDVRVGGNGNGNGGSEHQNKKQRWYSPLEEIIDWCLRQKFLLGSSKLDAFMEDKRKCSEGRE